MAFTLRLSEEQQAKLDKLAKLTHASKAAIVKQAIDEKCQREAKNNSSLYVDISSLGIPYETVENDPFWASLPFERQRAYAETIASATHTLSYLKDH